MGTFLVGAVVFGTIALAAKKVYADFRSGAGCGSCKGCQPGNNAGMSESSQDGDACDRCSGWSAGCDGGGGCER